MFISIGGIKVAVEIVQFIAEQWIKHKNAESGLTTEELIAQATANYEAAKRENQELKDLGPLS